MKVFSETQINKLRNQLLERVEPGEKLNSCSSQDAERIGLMKSFLDGEMFDDFILRTVEIYSEITRETLILMEENLRVPPYEDLSASSKKKKVMDIGVRKSAKFASGLELKGKLRQSRMRAFVIRK